MRAVAVAATCGPLRARIRSKKARSGPGCLGDRPGGLAEHPARQAGPGLADPAVAGLGVAGLAHPRVEAEVADQLPCRGEAADIADRGHERRGGVHVDARDGHQPQDLRRAERLRWPAPPRAP